VSHRVAFITIIDLLLCCACFAAYNDDYIFAGSASASRNAKRNVDEDNDEGEIYVISYFSFCCLRVCLARASTIRSWWASFSSLFHWGFIALCCRCCLLVWWKETKTDKSGNVSHFILFGFKVTSSGISSSSSSKAELALKTLRKENINK